MIRLRKTISLIAAICMLLAALPTWAAGANSHRDEVKASSVWKEKTEDTRVEHGDVNFFMTDLDYTSVTSVEDGGTGLHATASKRYTFLGVTEGSGMYSCRYLIDYPEAFVAITAGSNTFSGGLIALTNASIDEDEQTSDLFDSVCNLEYWGQTGGKPVGEEGNEYINGGVYLKSFDFMGVQLGGNFHRFTVRLDKTPFQSECEQDENGYYLTIGLEMLEFTYGVLNENGVLAATVNWCKPENIGEAPWLSWTAGKLYVNAKEDPVPATPEPTAEPTPEPTPTPEPGDHCDVNFYMTDLDYTSVTAVDQGGTGLHATASKRYTYLGITEGSGMYSCQYLIDYPEAFVTITGASNTFSGGLIAQTNASIAEGTQTSDLFDSVCNLEYWGQSGGKPVGEEGNEYINGGTYLKTFDFMGVQLGGNFHRFTVRLDKTPFQSECEQDENGYYLPIGLEMLEFTYGVLDENGVLAATVNWCKPENIGNAPWLSWTAGKIYVTPILDRLSASLQWDDDDDRDGMRPDQVTATLYVNGEATDTTLAMHDGNNWSVTFYDLTVYYNGVPAYYTVNVSDIPGYSIVILGNNAMDDFTITAVHTPEVTELSGTVIWVDGDDAGGIRPESVTMELTGNGETVMTFDVTAAGGWAWSIPDMYVYENHGEPIEYLIHEAEVERYYTEYSGLDVINTRIVSVSYIGGYTAEEELLFGGSVVLPVLDIPGIHYVFTVDGEPWDGTNITSDVTVEVDFEVDIYNVTFIDPVTGEVLAVEQAEYGEGVDAPAAPEHYGYEFSGWDCDFGEVYGDMTVTAVYAPVNFTVTFTDGLGYVISMQEVPYLTAANPPAVPQRTGWVFAGWDADYTCIEQDTVINAVWERQRLTISFTGAYTDTQTVYYGDDCILPVYASSAICYIFMVDGEEFCPENITEDANVTVSVALIKNTYYTVTFVGLDCGIISQQTVKHGQAATIPEPPAVPGYRFVGWDRDVEMLSCVTYSCTRYALYEPAGEPETQTGDINGDGEVTFADISALYSFLLGSSDITVTLEMGDINADGEVTFADISALYDRIIS